MKVSYQNYRQQKQSSKVMRSYIVQAAAKGATEEELDILCQAYLLEQKYGLAVNSTTERRPPVRRIYDIAVFATRVDDAVLNMSVVRIGPNYVIDVPRIVQCFQMKGENHA